MTMMTDRVEENTSLSHLSTHQNGANNNLWPAGERRRGNGVAERSAKDMHVCVLDFVLFIGLIHSTPTSPQPPPGAPQQRWVNRQPETGDVIGQELAGYWRAVKKCTSPKDNIAQLLGLILFTVAQLRWITDPVRRWRDGQGEGA